MCKDIWIHLLKEIIKNSTFWNLLIKNLNINPSALSYKKKSSKHFMYVPVFNEWIIFSRPIQTLMGESWGINLSSPKNFKGPDCY